MTVATADLYRDFVLGNYAHLGLELVRGKGCRVWDANGKSYLDFCSGIAVCTLGHCHPRMVNALRDQAAQLIHISNLYLNRQQGTVAKRLVEAAGTAGRIFFCNSGAEANEAAYKIARKFGNTTRPPGYFAARPPEIVTFTNSFHGRTLGGIAATEQPKVKQGFEPMIPGFMHAPFNDVAGLNDAIGDATVAVLVEPVQGDGGIHAATAEFLRAIHALCRERNLLMMLDEIQCGLGRCGSMRAWEAAGAPEVNPDVVTWAKGLGGGFPVGAVWIQDRSVFSLEGTEAGTLPELLGPGSHGTTYGGSPLAAAVIDAVLDGIEDENLCENASARGVQAIEGLRALANPIIKAVRGLGLMIGLEIDAPLYEQAVGGLNGVAPSVHFTRRLMTKGLLAAPAGPVVVRWLPPLIVSEAEISEAIQMTDHELRGLAAEG